MTSSAFRGIRGALLVGVVATVAAGVTALCLPAVQAGLRLLLEPAGEPADRALGTLLGAVLGSVLLGAAAWLSVGVVLCLAELLVPVPHGPPRAAGARDWLLTPRLLRLVVGAVVGAGVAVTPGATADPAPAQPVAATEHPLVPVERLAGLPSPDRPTGATAGPRPDSSSSAEPRSGGLVVVLPGDSLWGVTERVLDPPPASPGALDPAVVDRGWRLLHAVNRDQLGSDPDLVHPGTVLEVPHRPPFADRDLGAP